MKVLIVIVLLTSPLVAADVTISFRFPGGADKIEFENTKFSESQIRTILTHFSPELAVFNGYMLPEELEACTAGDKRYRPCGTRNIESPNFLHNAAVNVEISKERLKELTDMAPPEELKVVQKYLEEFFRYGLRLQKCRLEYYKTWDENLLESCDALEEAKVCDVVAKKASFMTDRLQKYNLAQYDWPSCVVDQRDAQLGKYPEQAWKKFLETYGIKETVFEDND